MSPDHDFSTSGATSGIQYQESLKTYKELLTEQPGSPVFERIYSTFNTSLFGEAPPITDEFITDDGNYNSELEEFRNGLLADSPVKNAVDIGTSRAPSPSPLPALPLQSEHHVAISVISNVSRTITASSQVTNVVNSTVHFPSEHEVRESLPPNPKPARPAPKKKTSKQAKSTKTSDTDTNTAHLPSEHEVSESPPPNPKPARPAPKKKISKQAELTKTSDTDTNTAPTQNTKASRRSTTKPAEPTQATRVLRNRS